jgi:hypothetical protein
LGPGWIFTKLLKKVLRSRLRLESLIVIGQHILDTNAGKQLSQAATDVLLTLVLKNENLNIAKNFDHQNSPNKSKCWYSNNCLHFLKRAVPLKRELFDIRNYFVLKIILRLS